MAEQVVNIRDRIEKMRNQINDKLEPQFDHNHTESAEEKTFLKNEGIKSADKSKSSVIESEKRFKEETKTNLVSQKNNTEDIIKNNSTNDTSQKKETFEELNKGINKETTEKKISDFEEKKINQKSYKNYQVKNLVDEKQKPYEDNKSQAFPQFSLNVNNPISWKLMLLIMLMQLLTNIMLVVVLYLK
jgi:hypothetical protein